MGSRVGKKIGFAKFETTIHMKSVIESMLDYGIPQAYLAASDQRTLAVTVIMRPS